MTQDDMDYSFVGPFLDLHKSIGLFGWTVLIMDKELSTLQSPTIELINPEG